MVEKYWGSFATLPSSIVVDSVEVCSPTTVGAAIDIMEKKLADKGLVFQYPLLSSAPKSETGHVAKVAGKLLRLPILISLAITPAIDSNTKASEDCIGHMDSPFEKMLVPGNVVALYMKESQAFLGVTTSTQEKLYMKESQAFLGVTTSTQVTWKASPSYGGKKLPLSFESERFVVVDAGNNNVAFYSPCHRRFLGCKGGRLTAEGFPIVKPNESPRANECFYISKAANGRSEDQFCLHCPIENMDVVEPRTGRPAVFRAVQVYGFD